jgi:hypothetical protein
LRDLAAFDQTEKLGEIIFSEFFLGKGGLGVAGWNRQKPANKQKRRI